MVKTGYISFITETPAGKDSNGNVLASSRVYSNFIECNLKTISKEFKVLVQGEYIDASYSMIIDSFKIDKLNPAITISTIKEVKINNNNNDLLGDFRIINLEHLKLTKCIKIIV